MFIDNYIIGISVKQMEASSHNLINKRWSSKLEENTITAVETIPNNLFGTK